MLFSQVSVVVLEGYCTGVNFKSTGDDNGDVDEEVTQIFLWNVSFNIVLVSFLVEETCKNMISYSSD